MDRNNHNFKSGGPNCKKDKKWVNGRPTKVQQTTRPDTIWPVEWPKLSRNQKRDDIGIWDSWTFPKVVKLDQSLDMRYSFKAVYSQRGMLGDPHCYADVKLHKETRRSDRQNLKGRRTPTPSAHGSYHRKRTRFRILLLPGSRS